MHHIAREDNSSLDANDVLFVARETNSLFCLTDLSRVVIRNGLGWSLILKNGLLRQLVQSKLHLTQILRVGVGINIKGQKTVFRSAGVVSAGSGGHDLDDDHLWRLTSGAPHHNHLGLLPVGGEGRR